MKNFIPVNQPILSGNEKKYLDECIKTGWISSEGPFVSQFEDQFAKRVDRKYAIAVCNGSAALETAVAALNIGKGDQVIMPTFTIISSAAAVVRTGAVPVLIDSDPITWNIDVTQIEKKITSKTKAIMVVHIYGLPADMDPILSLAKKYGLKIIEDAAEMHGQTYKRRPCGSFGDVSIFSFYPNKLVTTGEGGMIVTDGKSLADKCKSLRNLCFQKKRFIHEELGWNFRMTNLQAAIGLAQLERLDEFVNIKKRMGKRYTELLKDIRGIQLPLPKTDYAENIYWVYGIVLKDRRLKTEETIEELTRLGIGTRPFFWPMHKQPVFRKMGLFKNEQYEIAEKLSHDGFYIPSGLALKEKEIVKVATSLKEILK